MPVFDTVRAAEFVKSLGYEEVVFAGEGFGGVIALLGAFLTDNRAEVNNLPPSFTEIASARVYHYNVMYDVYGLLRVFDIPDLLDT